MPPQSKQNSNDYDEKMIVYLEPREHVRKRPGMYIGGTDKRALHHLVWEVLDNSVEEAMIGKCNKILIQVLPNHNIRIEDNSEGLPIDASSKNKTKPILEDMMTSYNPKGNFQGVYYGISGGLHGLGLFFVNALCVQCTAEVKRDGYLWRQTYSEGIANAPVEKVRPLELGENTGTCIIFRPDFKILEENEFDFELIALRCQDLAYLFPQLSITVQDRREIEQERNYHYPKGLLEWVLKYTKDEILVHEPLALQYIGELSFHNGEKYKIGLDLAFQYIKASKSVERSFMNSVPIAEGGTHLEALKEALVKKLKHKNVKIGKRNVMNGLIVSLSLKHPDPQFHSPTKVTLLNRDVSKVIHEAIEAIFAAHPEAKTAIRAHFAK